MLKTELSIIIIDNTISNILKSNKLCNYVTTLRYNLHKFIHLKFFL